ncbi:hypothetical protein [Yinghuangia soli]|uniref:Uncharacterized protein n=1 Tax=Yinghuangia soli TaxID=2908204 RepID=A0AA41U505_9ACTN|nr:hypothetical protein [Yinghuangia soli]MCF2533490.1 hypothetical protein [Yinghuangia soli]
MLDTVQAAESPGPAGPDEKAGRLPRGRTPVALAVLAAAWALTSAAHLAGADAVLPLLAVLGAASLLRVGATLLDRLVVAVMAVAGAALIGGLLFSVWPWGLHPVAVAGTAFTLLVAAGWALRRRPRLPRRLQASDLVVAGTGLGAWLMVAWPTLTRPLVERIGYFAGNDTGDRLRQFSLFDAIRQIDGYAFMSPDQAHDILIPGMATNYPNGVHFLYALADSFRLSGAPVGNGLAAAHRYYALLLLGYGLFALVVVWAARWVAGRRADGWRGILVLSAIGTFLATGVLVSWVWFGFDSQVFGLVFAVFGAALMIRCPDRPVEQTALVGLALAGVAFTYPLYVPAMAAGAAVSLWVYRKRLLRRRIAVGAVAAAAVGLTLLPVLWPRLAGDFQAGDHLLLWGPIVRVPRRLLLAVTVIVVLALAVTRARRSPVQRLAAVQVGIAAAVALGLYAYQEIRIGTSSYYFEKLLYAWLVLALVALGGAAALLPRLRTARPVAAAVAAAMAGVLLAGGVSFGRTTYSDGRPGPDNTWAAVWADGRIVSPAQNELMAMQRRGLLGDGRFTMVVLRKGKSAWQNALTTMQAAVFNHQLGKLEAYVAAMPLVPTPGEDPRSALDPMWYVSRNWTENLAVYSRTSREPLRIVSFDAEATAELAAAAAGNPCRCVQIVPLGPGAVAR